MSETSISKEKISKESTDLVTRCKNIVITNQGEYDAAARLLSLIKGQKEKIGQAYDSIVEKAHQAHKEAVAKRSGFLNPLEESKKLVNRLMIEYVSEQEKAAKLEQKRLQDLADKAADIEKKKLEAKIARAEASGKEEKAEALKEEIETVTPIFVPVITPQVVKPQGVSYRDKFTAEVIDFSLLPDSYKLPNQSALDRIAQATKGTVPIPGVKFHFTKILVNRS